MDLLAQVAQSQDGYVTVMLALIEAAKLVGLAYIGYKVRHGVPPQDAGSPATGSRKRKK